MEKKKVINVAQLYHIELTTDKPSFEFAGARILENGMMVFATNIFDDAVIKVIGANSTVALQKFPIFIETLSLDQKEVFEVNNFTNKIHMIMALLWFVKDTCASAGKFYSYEPISTHISCLDAGTGYSNSQGYYPIETFTI